MDRRTTAPRLAAGALAGLITTTGLVTGPVTAPPAGAEGQQEVSRLPRLAEVTGIYPFLADDGTRVDQPGRVLVAPGDVDGSDCDYDRFAARAASGRGARYGNPDDTGFVSRNYPTVLARGFTTRAKARAAYDEVRARVARCLGTSVRRDGTVDRAFAGVPRLGGARFAYRETGRGTEDAPYLFTHRIVVLRGTTVVVAERSRPGTAAPPPRRPLERLTRLALRTL